MQRPGWIRAKAPSGANYEDVKGLVESARLHTVCHSADCPNIGECWASRTATFMILGDVCTRSCGFCAVGSRLSGTSCPGQSLARRELRPPDVDEPRRVAEAVAHLKLRHAVITSVTRDDLPDGGAGAFAEVMRLVREKADGCSVEVLIPDFQGDEAPLRTVLDARPEVLNHNMETVERLYPAVRPQAVYERSLRLIGRAKEMAPEVRTKSGLMVGLGETWQELMQTIADLRSVHCDALMVGQYLAPTKNHVPIHRYYTPEEFSKLKSAALAAGFGYVESGPLVRSSYHAADQVR